MIRRGTVLTILLVLFSAERTLSQEAKGQGVENQTRCEPIGRILTRGDPRLAMGSLICQGDQLRLPTGMFVEVLCYVNRQVIPLPSGLVSNAPGKCVPPQKRQSTCPRGANICFKPKGPGQNPEAPFLVRPYGGKITEERPTLTWTPLADATSYSVTVNGTDIHWTRTVETTELTYPQDQPSLKPGHNYKIVLIKNRGNSPVAVNEFVVRVSPKQEKNQLSALIKQVEALNLPPDEMAYRDIDTLYMSRNLLNATIENLEERVNAGSIDPTLYRVLGDRYLEAGAPIEAKRNYQQATKLAQDVSNALEYNRAKRGLAEAQRYSQLPTNTNGAQ